MRRPSINGSYKPPVMDIGRNLLTSKQKSDILHAGKDLSNEYLDKLICPEEFWHISFFIQIHCLEIFLHIGFLDWKNSNIQFLSGRSCGIKLCLSRFSFKDLGHITCIVWKSSEQHNLPITRASQASTH